MLNGFAVISDIALAFIAFSIGSEFSLDYFKKVGKAPIIIAIFEAIIAVILVTGILILVGFDMKLSLLLGAIAAATAPAQTIMVINQYKAKGKLTSLLMSVIAIDDAVALIGFGFAATIVNLTVGNNSNLILSLLKPIYEILISVIIGFVFSLVMKLLFKRFKKPSNVLSITISCILFSYWIAEISHGSPLLACMSLGAFLANIYFEIGKIMKVSEGFTAPIFMMFFVISGAGFEIKALPAIGLIGILYVVFRVIGKWFGAWMGCKLTNQDDKICKYLGPTLMPQAGVALGLVVVAGNIVPQYESKIRVVILCSTFIYSLIGPITAKIALQKAGDISSVNTNEKLVCKVVK
jgi:Kef-type K+ transport system membrane component KefB